MAKILRRTINRSSPPSTGSTPSKVFRSFLDKRAHKDYGDYSIYVNEERAFSGDVDGLKPVARRLLWTAYEIEKARSTSKYIKSARITASCMGHFHPHGDPYGALVTMANMSEPLIDGQGNFGFWDDPPAANRYTEARLSKFAEKIFFDPFYLPVMETCLNYDDVEREPVQLPALLPNLLINGNNGIGVGFATFTPSFTVASVAKLLKVVLARNAPCTAGLAAKYLEFNVKTGGEEIIETDEQKQELFRFFKTGKGRVNFRSIGKLDGRNLSITGFAPFTSMERAIERTIEMNQVALATDTSNVKQRSGSALVKLKGSVNGMDVEKVKDGILNGSFGASHSYDFKFTVRYKNGDDVVSRLRDWPLPKLVDHWLEYRLELEKKACQYWIEQVEREISRLELLRLAIKHLDYIIGLIRSKNPKYTRDEIKAKLVARMKISLDDADYIIHRELIQLSALEDDSLVAKIEEKRGERNGYVLRKKSPEKYLPGQIDSLLKSLSVKS